MSVQSPFFCSGRSFFSPVRPDWKWEPFPYGKSFQNICSVCSSVKHAQDQSFIAVTEGSRSFDLLPSACRVYYGSSYLAMHTVLCCNPCCFACQFRLYWSSIQTELHPNLCWIAAYEDCSCRRTVQKYGLFFFAAKANRVEMGVSTFRGGRCRHLLPSAPSANV